MKILTKDAPSLLTASILRRIQKDDPSFTIPLAWQLVMALDDVNTDVPKSGWSFINGEIWWLSEDGRRFLPPSALNTDELKVPTFAKIRISSNTKILTGPPRGEVLARTEVSFLSPLVFEWILTSPEEITAPVNLLVYWAAGLLGSSLLISGIGIYTIVRSIRREQRLNQLKSQFISSVSHELRTPVGSIRLVAETLETGRVTDPSASYHLISKESKRLSHLIENVLNFSRIEEGKYDYHFENSDLSLLIQDALEILSPRVLETNHTLELSLEPCEASVDPQALQQAIINLVDNSLKFSPPASVVEISLTSNESHWAMAITNQGPGIPPSEHRQIFERFYRLGDELRRNTTGSGIGLSIVQQIAEVHQGSIQVTSEVAGPTTFTFSAPLNPSPIS